MFSYAEHLIEVSVLVSNIAVYVYGKGSCVILVMRFKPCKINVSRCISIFSFQVNNAVSVPVSTSASDLDIPGLHLIHDFVTSEEEQVKD